MQTNRPNNDNDSNNNLKNNSDQSKNKWREMFSEVLDEWWAKNGKRDIENIKNQIQEIKEELERRQDEKDREEAADIALERARNRERDYQFQLEKLNNNLEQVTSQFNLFKEKVSRGERRSIYDTKNNGNLDHSNWGTRYIG